MSKGLADIIKGRFLIKDGAIKNWVFILFCTVLCLLVIYSSHSAEKKVLKIADLNTKVKELHSEYVETKKQVMQLKMESNVASKMYQRGIKLSKEPPFEIIVSKTN